MLAYVPVCILKMVRLVYFNTELLTANTKYSLLMLGLLLFTTSSPPHHEFSIFSKISLSTIPENNFIAHSLIHRI